MRLKWPHSLRSGANHLLLFGVLSGLGLSASSWARAEESVEEDGSPKDDQGETERGRRVRDASRFRSAQWGAMELRLGPYRPRIDSEFGGSASPFEELFGTGPSVGFAIEGDWQLVRIPHFGSFGPGFGVGYVRYDAGALRAVPDPNDPNARSAQPTSLWIIPTFGVAVLRVDVFARELRIPIVPYVKGGLAYNHWEANDAGSRSEYDGVYGRGREAGVIAMVGGMLLLDFFAPQQAIDMDNITGVNHAYLFGEWMLSDVSGFGSGLQTGTNTWQTGLALEF